MDATGQIVMVTVSGLRYLRIGKRRLSNVERANARGERWFAVLANFLKAHRALGFFLERKSQGHHGHCATSIGYG